MSKEHDDSIKCPLCGDSQKLQRRSTVDIYDGGYLESNGHFQRTYEKDPEIIWDTQNEFDEFFCLNCDKLYDLIFVNGFPVLKEQ